MEEKKTCPNCYSFSIKKKTGRESNKPSPARQERQEDEENNIYECRSCGRLFDEDDLLNLEMEKY